MRNEVMAMHTQRHFAQFYHNLQSSIYSHTLSIEVLFRTKSAVAHGRVTTTTSSELDL